MAKKALCVGINDYPYDGTDLNGCVNDAKAWAGLLTSRYDFPSSNVTLLLDAQATKTAVMEGLKSQVADAKAGDVLVFTNSSHGTYIADESGEEWMYARAICPYDCADNLIEEDELCAILAELQRGVRFTLILDTSFGGTVVRISVAEVIPGLRTPDDSRVRSLSPFLSGRPGLVNAWKATPKGSPPEAEMKGIVLRGCSDSEYAYDALIEGVYHGAMTYYALRAIREANYTITYRQLLWSLRDLLYDAGYHQQPQLQASRAAWDLQVFV